MQRLSLRACLSALLACRRVHGRNQRRSRRTPRAADRRNSRGRRSGGTGGGPRRARRRRVGRGRRRRRRERGGRARGWVGGGGAAWPVRAAGDGSDGGRTGGAGGRPGGAPRGGSSGRKRRGRKHVRRWPRRRSGRRRGWRRRSRHRRRRRHHGRPHVHASDRSDDEECTRRPDFHVHAEFGRQHDLHGPGLDLEPSTSTFTRAVQVYVPMQYNDGNAAPVHGHPGRPGQCPHRRPRGRWATQAGARQPDRLHAISRGGCPLIAISVANGGGDSNGSERGLEYDTMSDRYARFIDTEVLPAVLANDADQGRLPEPRASPTIPRDAASSAAARAAPRRSRWAGSGPTSSAG